MTWMQNAKERAGWVSIEKDRAIWILGSGLAAFRRAEPLIDMLQVKYPRAQFLFTAGSEEARAWLSDRFPEDMMLPAPWPTPWPAPGPALWPTAGRAGRVIRRAKVRMIIALGGLGHLESHVLGAAYRWAVPVVVAGGMARASDPDAAQRRPEPAKDLAQAALFLVRDPAAEIELKLAGVSSAAIQIIDSLDKSESLEQVMARFSPILARDLKNLRSERRAVRQMMQRLISGAMAHPLPRRLLSSWVERIDSLAALRAELGSPETILCLGNGPSSEDPRLSDVSFDTLFRVNHSWQKRGFLAQPDMIFSGSKSTLAAISGTIFGFQSIETELRLLLSHLFPPTARKLRYATVARLDTLLHRQDWGALRPTNGMAMLATATALKPKRLIVAGIDLYQHPEGSYPGDETTPNAYTPGHSRDLELDFTLRVLRAFEGEIIVIGEVLEGYWAENQRRAGTAHTNL